jgi:hypothetical protein
LHTVDSATALLNSPRAFPSRISIPPTSNRHFSSLARRLGRIFAHAFFHHREIFEQAEAESSLYARFLALTSRFDLVPPEFLVIPPRLHPEDAASEHVEPPRLLAAAIEPHPPSLEKEPSPEPRKSRNRTDTMVFSEAYSYAEDLVKSDSGELAPPAAESEPELEQGQDQDPEPEPVPELEEGSVAAVTPEAQAPNVLAPMEVEDSGVPIPTHEPAVEEGLHPSSASLPEALVDPALARGPSEDTPPHDAEAKDDAPESRDVTEHQEASGEGAEDTTGEASSGRPAEHDGEEADVTDEPLHEEAAGEGLGEPSDDVPEETDS